MDKNSTEYLHSLARKIVEDVEENRKRREAWLEQEMSGRTEDEKEIFRKLLWQELLKVNVDGV